jgi:hypothetical protein
MPKFVPVDNSKKVDGLKLPVIPKFEPYLNFLNPIYNPWKESSFHRFNWFGKLNASRTRQIKLPVPGEGLPRVYHYCADQGGCAFWRLIFPGDEMLANNKAVIQTFYQMILDPRAYFGISAIRLQRQCSKEQLEFIKHLRNISEELKRQGQPGFRIIWESDDIVNAKDGGIPAYNACRSAFEDPQIVENVREMTKYIDEMTVSSVYLKEYYRKLFNFNKISVIPNYVPRFWFDKNISVDQAVENYKKHKERPRILYAGSMTHFDVGNLNGQVDDFYHVSDFIIKDLEEDKKYSWVFVGGFPYKLKKYIDNGQIEYHPWTSITEYPRLLASLNVNLMYAPLADNTFNRAKANIKLTEGAALKIPCVAQNLDCYNSDGWPYLFDTGEQLMQQIGDILESEESFRKAVEQCEKYVSKYWLSEHLAEWTNVYSTPYGDPKRKEQPDFYERNKEQFE